MTTARSSRKRSRRDDGARTAAAAATVSHASAWTGVLWALPVVLGILQWYASELATHQIRYEELAESIRNVFWLNQRLVYDGISSNVGWYGTLLVVYKIFGFTMASAKWVRLVLAVTGLFCAADILRRAMGARLALAPLVVIGISPALLYFNTLQTSYGVDVPYAAICLWLVLSIRPDGARPLNLAKSAATGCVAMIAAMSYPSFLFYLPSLAMIAIWWARRDASAPMSGVAMAMDLAAGLAGFALPLVLAWIYLRNPSLLAYDPATHAGLFRGGAQVGLSATLLWQSIGTVAGDLFSHGQSYYFEVTQPDLSGWLAMAACAGVAAFAMFLAVTRRAPALVVAAVLLLLIANVIGPNLSVSGPPGLRRCTGLLVTWFVAYAMVWKYAATPSAASWVRRAGVVLCLLVIVGSAIKLPSLFDDLRSDSLYRDGEWFAIEATPARSLDRLLTQFDQGKGLACPVDQERRIQPCRYQEVYAAMAGSRTWNRRPPVEIEAIDWKTGNSITLSTTLWTDYYFPH